MPSAELRHPEEAQSAVSKDAAGVRSQIWSCAVLAGDKGVPALAAQFARRAGAAAIAPIVAMRAVAFIAAMSLVANQLDERIAAQFTRQRQCRRLVAPHQRRVDHKAMLHAERQGRLQRLQRIVAAIGIAGVIGLAHAADEVLEAAPVADRRRKGEEQDVAAGHKGVRQSARLETDRAVAGQRRVADPAEHAEIDEMIDAELFVPFGKVAAQARLDRLPAVELDPAPLAIVEAA